jgi:hypothetical protein
LLTSRVGQRWIFRSNSSWLGGERITDFSVLTLCSAFILMGVMMLGSLGLDALRADAAGGWPTTVGTVVSVAVDEVGYGVETHWFPRVTYQYTVQGRTMLSTQITPGQQPHWRESVDASHFLERYVTRSRVLVYYNPENAAESVLEARQAARTQPALGLGVTLVVLGFWCLVVYDWLR